MRRAALVSLAASLVVTVFAVPALSAATRMEFTATASASLGDPGELRFSGESEVAIIRDREFVFGVTGVTGVDISGTLTAFTNFNQRFDTGDATLFGTFVLSTQEGASWEGRFAGTLAGGLVDSITLVGHGADGTKLMATMTQSSGVFAIEGVILDPQG